MIFPTPMGTVPSPSFWSTAEGVFYMGGVVPEELGGRRDWHD